jgi:hypothetical protein
VELTTWRNPGLGDGLAETAVQIVRQDKARAAAMLEFLQVTDRTHP